MNSPRNHIHTSRKKGKREEMEKFQEGTDDQKSEDLKRSKEQNEGKRGESAIQSDASSVACKPGTLFTDLGWPFHW